MTSSLSQQARQKLAREYYEEKPDPRRCTPPYFNNASTTGIYTGNNMNTSRDDANDNQLCLSKGGSV